MAALESAKYLAQLYEAGHIKQEHFHYVSRLLHRDFEHATLGDKKPPRATRNRDITLSIQGTVGKTSPTLKASSHCGAVSKVLGTQELLEQILIYVGNRTLRIAVNHVCKDFRNAIEGSITLQRKLMFAPDWRCDRLWLTAPGFEQEAWLGLMESLARSGWCWRQISREHTHWAPNKYDLTDSSQSIASMSLATERFWNRPTAKLQLIIPGPLGDIPAMARVSHSSLRRVLVCQPPVIKLRCRWSWSSKDLGCGGMREGGAELSAVRNGNGITWGDIFDATAGQDFGLPARKGLGPVFLFQGYWDPPQ